MMSERVGGKLESKNDVIGVRGGLGSRDDVIGVRGRLGSMMTRMP